MERRRIFPEVMLQIAIAAIGCMLFNIPMQAGGQIPVTVYFLLFAYAPITYLADRLFLRSPKSLTASAIFNMALFLAGIGAAFLLHQIKGAVSGIFIGLFFIILTVMAFKESSAGISINMLTVCFDILAVLLMIYILCIELGSGQLPAAIPGAAGTIAAFAGIIVYRDGNGISGRDRLYIILIIAGILIVAFLLHLLAGDSLREGLNGIFAGIGAAFVWLGRILKKILLFFKNLFPEPEYEAVDIDMGGGMSMPEGQGAEEEGFSAAPVLILLGILFLAAVIAAFIIFRKNRFSRSKTSTAAAVKSSERQDRISLWKALKIWFSEKMYRIRVKFYYIKNRQSPIGRFYKLVRSQKHTANALRQGETPSEFLHRYIGSLKPEDKRIPELKELVSELNLQLYRPS